MCFYRAAYRCVCIYCFNVSQTDNLNFKITYFLALRVQVAVTSDLSLAGGNIGTAFAIDASSGAVTLASALDYETVTAYTLVVAARDKAGGVGALSALAAVIVSVTGVNEHAPVYTQTTYSPSVSESLAVGDLVQTVVANDADTGPDGDVFYAMSAHTQFYLDSASGSVYSTSALDYETTQSYRCVRHLGGGLLP